MNNQANPIGTAAQAEGEIDDRTRDTLIEAGYALLESLFDPEEWPTYLRDRAKKMVRTLQYQGSIPRTVEAMDSRTVFQLLVDIRIVAADIETARIKGLVRSIARTAGFSPGEFDEDGPPI